MEKKAHYTNEKLSKKFKSNFELVSYAIRLADNMIRSGRDTRVNSETQNKAMQILEEILEGKDYFEPIEEKIEANAEINNEKESREGRQLTSQEKREKKIALEIFDSE